MLRTRIFNLLAVLMLCSIMLPQFTYASEQHSEPTAAEETNQKQTKEKSSNKSTSNPSTSQEWALVDQTAEQMYRKVVDGDQNGAFEILVQLEAALAAPHLFDEWKAEHIHVITGSYVELKRQFHAIKRDSDALEHAVAKFRFATDAVTHPDQPMWLQYADILRDDLDQMLQAVDSMQWEQSSRKWLEHIDRILPAASLQRSPNTIEMIHSVMALVQQSHKSKVTVEQVKRTLQEYEGMWMKELFGPSKDLTTFSMDQEQPLPMRAIIWLTGIVTVTLAYVAYQKYRDDEEQIRSGPWNPSA
ncbi:sporulation protein YpjB [Paenibacillus sp. 1001270B_150601_E10]|uniref:sporulation protein YpjB n=1 Tax=Paenibacillus sp. 1001270B_150601_E10 TaxID=2787079 RepID=UPI00189CA158|nr:sporulation protein YpjB [Paenibacillus sp. 1001270B_150601_E10]